MGEPSKCHVIFDKFIELIDKSIDTGNPNLLKEAIDNFKDDVGESYIVWANQLYEQMIIEKIDNINLK